MPRTVVFAPEARSQLLKLNRYIAGEAGINAADRYTDALIAHCESLGEFPERTMRRDDIRPGLHLMHFRKRATIAYIFDESRVTILGIFVAGQDYNSRLRDR